MRSLSRPSWRWSPLVSQISCGGIVDPSKNQMESFSGEVAPQGFSSHPFKTDRTGEISIKLTALAPLNNVPLGIIWAQADSNGNCVSVIQSSVANLNLPAISGQIFKATTARSFTTSES